MDSIKNWGWVLSVALIATAALYLDVYYRPFGINPFSFISPADAVGHALRVLVMSATVVALGLVASFLGAVKQTNTPLGYGALVLPVVVFFCAILASAGEFPLLSQKHDLLFVAIVPSVLSASYWGPLMERIPSRNLRIALISLVFSFPLYAILNAMSDVKAVREGKKSTLVRQILPGDGTSALPPETRALVGKLGSTYFFLSRSTGRVIVVNEDKLESLELRPEGSK
ncbi:hypothetical protein CTP10_R64360 (plasmid) [Cupriavidus sp. P-10]|uniref:hypothetical protein n=1 Tax=Cupriavidus sp. P-10 TaxID=2027911 RepID=UPI0011C1B229|nr:hypothetical protein [Cupriavidus sp. P-10]BDB29023.1 hypothetical protein CTP10_R64360 [Cupriavidus sp. P-10]